MVWQKTAAPSKKKEKPANADKSFAKQGIKAKKAAAPHKTASQLKKPRLRFVEVERKVPKKPSALRSAPLGCVKSALRQQLSEGEQDNLGLQGARSAEKTAHHLQQRLNSALQHQRLRPYRKAERLAHRLDRTNLKILYRKDRLSNPAAYRNPLAKQLQKRRIRKQYAVAKRHSPNGTVRTDKMRRQAGQRAKKSVKALLQKLAGKKVLALVGGIAFLLMTMMSMISSCSVLLGSAAGGAAGTTFPSEGEQILAAENAYLAKEQQLQAYLDNYESTHDYDEYRYDLDEITHDPYVLASLLTVIWQGSWTANEVEGLLQELFAKQYALAETVTTERRSYEQSYSWTDKDGNSHSGSYTVYYDYHICTVTLKNRDLARQTDRLTEEQKQLYAVYRATLGNRPDLFPSAQGGGAGGTVAVDRYEVPPEALQDQGFAAMLREGEKYLGWPYVWGGSSPSTSFDCSGFVCWVINNSGIGKNVGRTTAEGLRQRCAYVSPADAKPGDLVFFENTYPEVGASHIGIYVGNRTMLHCGDPISYASLDNTYWQTHFMQFGRLR